MNFFRGVLIVFITSIVWEITSFFASVYKRQILLLFRGITFIMMGMLGIVMFLLVLEVPTILFGRNGPGPLGLVFFIIGYVLFKWLRKAEQLLSLELKNMKNARN